MSSSVNIRSVKPTQRHPHISSRTPTDALLCCLSSLVRVGPAECSCGPGCFLKAAADPLSAGSVHCAWLLTFPEVSSHSVSSYFLLTHQAASRRVPADWTWVQEQERTWIFSARGCSDLKEDTCQSHFMHRQAAPCVSQVRALV